MTPTFLQIFVCMAVYNSVINFSVYFPLMHNMTNWGDQIKDMIGEAYST
jgi:hypothetical protein